MSSSNKDQQGNIFLTTENLVRLFFLVLRLQHMNDLLETKACFASTTCDILIVVFTYRPLIIALSYNVSNLHEYQQ